MTLIASTLNYAYPIIVGDILMTSEEVKRDVAIPTFLKSVNDLLPADHKFFPFSLRQKIYVVTDSLAIALAGSEFQMRLFLEDIRMNFKYKPCTHSNVVDFVNGYDYSNFDQSACLLLHAEKKEEGVEMNTITIGKWQEAESPTLEYVYACGTGSEYFLNNSSQRMHFGNAGDPNALYRAISLNYIQLSKLLGIERLNMETLKNSWGAGFEMIYFDGERFRKMDDITFII